MLAGEPCHPCPVPADYITQILVVSRLGYNEISADGASSLATLLRSDGCPLETLELQGNRIGDVGAVALARGLEGRRTKAPIAGHRQRGLRQLNLGGNRIGCIGGCALARALRESGSRVVLEELELSGNPVRGGSNRG